MGATVDSYYINSSAPNLWEVPEYSSEFSFISAEKPDGVYTVNI